MERKTTIISALSEISDTLKTGQTTATRFHRGDKVILKKIKDLFPELTIKDEGGFIFSISKH